VSARIRPHLSGATPAPPVVTPVVTPTATATTVPGASQPTTRDVTLEISDTAMGTIIPINLGKFYATFKIVHFDLPNNSTLEMIALIGEGPIDAVEGIWIDSTPVYGTALTLGQTTPLTVPSWVESIVIRTGTPGQTPPGNITNSTIAQLAWPGFAYVSIRLNLQTAAISGGLPRVTICGRGLLGWNFGDAALPAPDLPLCWSENPIGLLYALMRSPDFGCGLSKAMFDVLENTPGRSWYDAALACDQVADRLTVQPVGNTTTNAAVGGNPGSFNQHGQAFAAVNDSFAIQVKLKVLNHGVDGKGWPDLLSLRASWWGSPSPLWPVGRLGGSSPGWTCSQDGSTPLVPVPINGPGDYYLTAWYGNDLNEMNSGRVFTTGMQLMLSLAENASVQWYANTLSGGLALPTSADTIDSYNHETLVTGNMWYQTAVAEKSYRLELIVTQRQPIEQVVTPILQVCNGRWGVWDGLYRVSIDDNAAAPTITISDQESDSPDILITQDTLQCTRSTPDVPNVAIGDFIDTMTWDREEVSVAWLTVTEGLDQFRELRFSCLAVPSGDQMYRLLSTWLARGRRTWKAACSVPQHGIRLRPGDLVFLKSRLFTSTKTVMVDTVKDNTAGTFDLTLIEYNAADFCTVAYVPQTVVTTVTQLPNTA
jgi:hypothetical protein